MSIELSRLCKLTETLGVIHDRLERSAKDIGDVLHMGYGLDGAELEDIRAKVVELQNTLNMLRVKDVLNLISDVDSWECNREESGDGDEWTIDEDDE